MNVKYFINNKNVNVKYFINNKYLLRLIEVCRASLLQQSTTDDRTLNTIQLKPEKYLKITKFEGKNALGVSIVFHLM